MVNKLVNARKQDVQFTFVPAELLAAAGNPNPTPKNGDLPKGLLGQRPFKTLFLLLCVQKENRG